MINCDSSAILRMIMLAKQIINIIRIIVPIILIIMCMIDVVRLVASGMDSNSKTFKKIGDRILAAIIVFLVPTFLNMVLQSVNVGAITTSTCWVNANAEMVKELKAQEQAELADIEDAKKKAADSFDMQWKEEQLRMRTTMNFAQSVVGNPEGGGVLIVAGHAYPGTCDSCSSECRGYTTSGYAEEVETRSLALSLKKALLAEGINAVIANQVLLGNEEDEKMDVSFRCSRMGAGPGADAYQQLENSGFWSKFAHTIEIHFNAFNGSVAGSELVVSSGKQNQLTPRDNKLVEIASKYSVGGLRSPQLFSGGLGDWEFFVNTKQRPMTYIEIEFYDNKAAMDSYKTKQEQMAKEMAQFLKSEGIKGD